MVSSDMAAAPPSLASRMILHPALVHELQQNTSGVFIRTDVVFCCDQMRSLCAPNKLRPSTDAHPNCLFYSGGGSLDGRCVMNTPIRTFRDPRSLKNPQAREVVSFDTVADYLVSLLPIRNTLCLLQGNERIKQFAELRHCVYTAIALHAMNVTGKVCRAKY